MFHPIRRPAVALPLAAGLALAGCSSSGTASGGSSSSAPAAAGVVAPGAGAAGSAAARAGSTADRAGQSTLDPSAVKPRVVRTAQVVVEANGTLSAAAAKVRALAQSLGGSVANETTTYAGPGGTTPAPGPAGSAPRADATPAPARTVGPGESVLVVRVPADALDRALTLLTGATGVGKELSRSATSQDVTGDLADLQSRVATQRASVTRVRALLARATSVAQVVSIESELTKRESDLEAAEARQAALADRADFATLTVDLRTPDVVPPPPPAQANPFVEGLRSGWHAVAASTAVILTVLGALLPVAVVLAVLGAPVLWWWRRRRGGLPPVAPAPAVPDAGA